MVRTAKSLLPKIPSNQYLALLTYLCVPMLWCELSPSKQSIETKLKANIPQHPSVTSELPYLTAYQEGPADAAGEDKLQQSSKSDLYDLLPKTKLFGSVQQAMWTLVALYGVVVNHPNPIHDAYMQPVSSDKTSWNVTKAAWNHNYQHWQWWLVADQGGCRGTKEPPFGRMWKIVRFKLLVNLKLCSCIF